MVPKKLYSSSNVSKDAINAKSISKEVLNKMSKHRMVITNDFIVPLVKCKKELWQNEIISKFSIWRGYFTTWSHACRKYVFITYLFYWSIIFCSHAVFHTRYVYKVFNAQKSYKTASTKCGTLHSISFCMMSWCLESLKRVLIIIYWCKYFIYDTLTRNNQKRYVPWSRHWIWLTFSSILHNNRLIISVRKTSILSTVAYIFLPFF